MTTHSCLTCYDPDCNKVGQDLAACEHHMRMEDVTADVPVDESSPFDAVLYQVSEKVDALEANVKLLAASVDRLYAVLAAAVHAVEGDER